MNIDVIAPNWLGDAVMSLPALAALRARHPDAALHVYARRGVAPVYELTQLGLRVSPLPEPPSLRVGRASGDVMAIFPNSFYSALVGMALRGKRRSGYARDRRSWLLQQAIAPPGANEIRSHESNYYLELLRRSGLVERLPEGEQPVMLYPPAAIVAGWRERFAGAPLVAVHVGATFGTAKRWLPERFAAIAAQCVARGWQVAFIGGKGERELAEQVRVQGGGGGVNLAGETNLTELIGLLAASSALVANDSGPMHLAAAVGTPVVALFGSTNHRETYPLAEHGRMRLLRVEGVACSPCKLRDCPIDHRCMTRLEVATVWQALQDMLESAHD
ncbi:MAG TPA: lipopolysaccharide heptosyltransferase II [Terriglobales bacterium]